MVCIFLWVAEKENSYKTWATGGKEKGDEDGKLVGIYQMVVYSEEKYSSIRYDWMVGMKELKQRSP